MSIPQAALLGLIQGLVEWLPVSSEGVVTVVYGLAFDASLSDSVAFSLWLHLGTVLSVLAAFRAEVGLILRDAVRRPLGPSPLLTFLLVGTLASAPLGLVLLIGLEEMTDRIGVAAMGLVGLLMLITGAVLLRTGASGFRTRRELTWLDGLLTGLAQGAAALPGLSRSGLTVSALLGRRIDRDEALTLSFLLSVPASLGAGAYAAIRTGAYASVESVIAVAIAGLVGFLTIRALINLARRVNFGWFMVLVGASTVVGAVWAAAFA